MNKQLRNRRSASSCSNYSQHSVSMVNLQSAVEQPISKQPVRQRKVQYAEIQRLYIHIYQELKKYGSSNTQEPVPDKQIINKWRKTLKIAIEQNREYYRSLTHTITTLKLSLTQVEQTKDMEIKNIKAIQVEELKLLENEMSRKIIDVNGDFSRKQQEYKEVISRFIDTLHKSQRNWSKIYTQISGRLKKAEQLFKQRVEVDSKNHQIYEQIASFTNQIYGQHDESLGSINLSYDQLGLHPQAKQLESRRNTIDISSIQQIYEDEGEQTRGRWGLEDCLIQLIHWGFFLEKNQGNIKKLMSITKDLDNPEQIVKQPIFPILIQSIKLQLNFDKEMNSIVQDNSEIYYESQDRVVMRDIENEMD